MSISPHGPTVTNRSDLSTLYKIFRKTARPVRSHILSVGGNYPTGSPRIEKHPKRVGKVEIIEQQIITSPHTTSTSPSPSSTQNSDNDSLARKEVLWTYSFHPPADPPRGRVKPSEAGKRKHIVYFFAGGGFVQPAESEQWKLCAYLASALAQSDVQIVLVSYPLAPNSPAKDSLPILRRWMRQALADAETENSMVSFLGDSAGGNIALSLALWWADDLVRGRVVNGSGGQGIGKSVLRSVLMVSPPLDMRVTNPEIGHTDELDPILGKGNAETAAKAWSKGSDPSDPYLSPVLADLTNLKGSGIEVHCAVGTYDVLAPDVMVFLESCKEAGLSGNWLIWKGLMHDFPLAACYGLKEGKEGRAWIEKVLHSVSW
ncbi:Alpha/Beta hydrolase protein [Xylariaceae sp. FL1019]|nr:Alpha/Beta hydrolase protein [Xylariaceae sp. FL1019]